MVGDFAHSLFFFEEVESDEVRVVLDWVLDTLGYEIELLVDTSGLAAVDRFWHRSIAGTYRSSS